MAGIVASTRWAYPAGKLMVEETLPRMLVTVKTGSRNCRDAWHKLQRKLGLLSEPVQYLALDQAREGTEHDWRPLVNSDANNAFATVYDVAGSVEALETLTNLPICLGHQYAVNVRVGQQGQGGGEARPRRRISEAMSNDKVGTRQAFLPDAETTRKLASEDAKSVKTNGFVRQLRGH